MRIVATLICTGLLAAAPAAASVTFTEVSQETGLRLVHDSLAPIMGPESQNLYGPGVAIEDVNNDGWLDIFFTNGPNAGNRLFLNNGDWTFTDVSQQMAVSASRGGNGAAFGDIDNDGRPDLIVANFHQSPYAYLQSSTRFLNNDQLYGLVPLIPGSFDAGDGTFFPSPESMGAAFGDYDQDGYVDLYIANYRFQVDLLFRNDNGSGFDHMYSFPEPRPGQKPFYGFTGVFTDLDDDGDLDIYVANDFGVNTYYENQGEAGGWAMVEKARELGIQGGNTDVHPKGLSMGLAIADYDNDLDLDIYITNFQLNVLFRNDGFDESTGNIRFTDVANAAGVEYPLNCWGVDLADFDNDTDLDLIFASGHIFSNDFFQPFEIPDQFYLNNGPESGYTFTAAGDAAGFNATQFGRGLATGDLDRDGDLDVVTTNNTYYEDTPVDFTQMFEGHTMVFRNDQATGHNWVNLRLQGSAGNTQYQGVTNRMGIGAKVYLTTTDGLTMMREVHAGTSYLSHHSLEVEFGLGDADVQSVEVRWPGGALEEFTNVRANRFHRLIEGAGAAQPVSLALSSFSARAFDRGVQLEWVSAPGVEIVGVVVERANARTPDAFERIDDVQITRTLRGGQVFDPTVVPGETYLYRLGLRLADGGTVETAVAEVRAGGANLPSSRRAAVGQNYPNPFNPSTRIEFTLPRSMHARLVIHDARGRAVRTLVDDVYEAGTVAVDWDGRTDDGGEAASGVYHYVLVTEDGTSARRMVLAR